MVDLACRHVVVGAGVVGTAAAYHLARRGEPVVVVERFALGHDRGSSHGKARIIRHSYAEEWYARKMAEAYACWRELEADAGVPLYVRTGGVSVSPVEVGYARKVAASLAAVGVPHRVMTGVEVNARFAAFQMAEDAEAVFEPDAGMLAAERAVRVQLEMAQLRGGARTTVREGCRVERIDLDGKRPVLLLEGGERIEAERLVVAAGAWVSRLLPSLGVPLSVTRQRVLYFGLEAGGEYDVGRMPVFISMGGGADDAFYAMPRFLGCDVKVARHGGPEIDPEQEHREVSPGYEARVRQFLAENLPGLAAAEVTRRETCLYTLASGEEFRVGLLPGRADVVVASPCSGHGFKFGNLVGRVVADLAMTGEGGVDRWML